MPALFDLLCLAPVQRGFVATILTGITLPIVGVAIVALGIYPLRFTMMHVALLGLAIGQLTGTAPTLVAVFLCALTGAGLGATAYRPQDATSAMGFLMPMAIALAFLVLAAAGVHAADAFALLWGSILVASWAEIALVAVVGLGLLVLAIIFRQELSLTLLDPELAWTNGIETRRLSIFLFTGLAVAMAAAVRLTGALLVDAVTILPALTARALATSLPQMALLAMAAGLTGNLVGFALALLLDAPPGPILVLTAGALTLTTHTILKLRRRS